MQKGTLHSWLQTAKRMKNEGWTDLTNRLRELAQKVYLDLEEKAKEELALNVFLSRIDNPHVAFSVKQKRPASLDEAISTTLKLECYANAETRTTAVVEVTEGVITRVRRARDEGSDSPTDQIDEGIGRSTEE